MFFASNEQKTPKKQWFQPDFSPLTCVFQENLSRKSSSFLSDSSAPYHSCASPGPTKQPVDLSGSNLRIQYLETTWLRWFSSRVSGMNRENESQPSHLKVKEMFYFDPLYFIIVAPALLLMMWAQSRVHSAFSRGAQLPAPLNGAQAARLILDRAGCPHVEIESTHGHLTDHYDPREKVLRLSDQVYHESSLSAVGIAAHEAGHAIQDARGYSPLRIRNGAVYAAQYGPMLAIVLFIIGALLARVGPLGMVLQIAGLVCFSGVVIFQLINLPVEIDASNRAKRLLNEYHIVDGQGAVVVRDVLNAAAWTYVAGTLQSILQMLYHAVVIFGGGRDNDR